MKHSYSQPTIPAYSTGALTDFAMEPLGLKTIIGKLHTHILPRVAFILFVPSLLKQEVQH